MGNNASAVYEPCLHTPTANYSLNCMTGCIPCQPQSAGTNAVISSSTILHLVKGTAKQAECAAICLVVMVKLYGPTLQVLQVVVTVYAVTDYNTHKLGPHNVVRALLYVQLSRLAINTPLCTPSACCAPIIQCLALVIKWYRLGSSSLHNCHLAVADLSMQLLQYGVLYFGILQMLQIYHAMQHFTQCKSPLQRAWKALYNKYDTLQSIAGRLQI